MTTSTDRVIAARDTLRRLRSAATPGGFTADTSAYAGAQYAELTASDGSRHGRDLPANDAALIAATTNPAFLDAVDRILTDALHGVVLAGLDDADDEAFRYISVSTAAAEPFADAILPKGPLPKVSEYQRKLLEAAADNRLFYLRKSGEYRLTERPVTRDHRNADYPTKVREHSAITLTQRGLIEELSKAGGIIQLFVSDAGAALLADPDRRARRFPTEPLAA